MTLIAGRPRELSIATGLHNQEGVQVQVADTGPGIGPEHLHRIFEAFFSTKTSGMGMGLAICRSIVEAHGGRLWAEGRSPHGSVFTMVLPAEVNAT